MKIFKNNWIFLSVFFICMFTQAMQQAPSILYELAQRAPELMETCAGILAVGHAIEHQNTHPLPMPDSTPQMPVVWENVTLVQDATAHAHGIDPHATSFDPIAASLDRLAHASLALESSCSSLPHEITTPEMSAQTSTADMAYEATKHLAAEMQELCNQEVIVPASSEISFSTDAAFDNRHAVDMEATHSYNTSSTGIPLKSHDTSKGIITKAADVTERLEHLISRSDDPKTLADQIEVSMGNTRMYRKILREETVAEYKDLLWQKNGHFTPINTPERQEKALSVLYPAIKAHFGRDKVGLINFLEKHAQQGTPGFQQLLSIESGKAGIGTHMTAIARNISSTLSSFNFIRSSPTTRDIGQGAFVGQLSKIVGACKRGDFVEARKSIEQFKMTIPSSDEYNRPIMIEEHNCLCAIYENFYRKTHNEYDIRYELMQDPQYSRCLGPLQRGTMKTHEAQNLLEARNYAFKATAYKLSLDPKSLSATERSAIYQAIDEQTRKGNLDLILTRKDLFNEKEIAALKEQINPAPQSGSSGTPSLPPPHLEPQDPKEKTEKINVQSEFEQNSKVDAAQSTSIKDTKIYRDSQQQIATNSQRFQKLGLKPISGKDLKHIVNNHTKVGEIAKQRAISNKSSTFSDDIELIDTILDAWEYGKEILDGAKEYDCGKIIGETAKGEPTSTIRVCLNQTRDAIRTAYPR